MKTTTLNHLINTSMTYPNYTFTFDVDKDNRDYIVRWGDIVLDLVDWNCGRIDWCLDVVINLFNSADEYVDSYVISPTDTELDELKMTCKHWVENYG